jgi:hypothetical protein
MPLEASFFDIIQPSHGLAAHLAFKRSFIGVAWLSMLMARIGPITRTTGWASTLLNTQGVPGTGGLLPLTLELQMVGPFSKGRMIPRLDSTSR